MNFTRLFCINESAGAGMTFQQNFGEVQKLIQDSRTSLDSQRLSPLFPLVDYYGEMATAVAMAFFPQNRSLLEMTSHLPACEPRLRVPGYFEAHCNKGTENEIELKGTVIYSQKDWRILPDELDVRIGNQQYEKCHFNTERIVDCFYTEEFTTEHMLCDRVEDVYTVAHDVGQPGTNLYKGLYLKDMYYTTVNDPVTKENVSLCFVPSQGNVMDGKIFQGGIDLRNVKVFIGTMTKYKPFAMSAHHQFKGDADLEVTRLNKGVLMNDDGMVFTGTYNEDIAFGGKIQLLDKTLLNMEFKPLPIYDGGPATTPPQKISSITFPNEPDKEHKVTKYEVISGGETHLKGVRGIWSEYSSNSNKLLAQIEYEDGEDGNGVQKYSSCLLLMILGRHLPTIHIVKPGTSTKVEEWTRANNPSILSSEAFGVTETTENE
jgi:hypothetical protein